MEKQKFVTVDGNTFDVADVLSFGNPKAFTDAKVKQATEAKAAINFANFGTQQADKLAEVYAAAEAMEKPAKEAPKAPAKTGGDTGAQKES